MTKYNINFKKLEESNINGFYFNEAPWFITQYFESEKQYNYPPKPYINEGIEDHIVQIIFLIKEYFTNKKKGFMGWNDFSKDKLLKLFDNDKYIYINNFENGDLFVNEFPEKITYFLNNYCYVINNDNS
mgnify:CR=1 FL=1|jgi:hypothetical protein